MGNYVRAFYKGLYLPYDASRHQMKVKICRIVGPSLAASLEPLAHCGNVASLSLFYRCYFGRCSSELAQLVPLPFS